MSNWLSPLRTWWQRLFFWQQPKTGSEEFQPHAHHDHALVLAAKEPSTRNWHKVRFLHYVLKGRERQLFWISIAVMVIALGAGSTLLIRPHVIRVPARGGTITEALIGSPRLINPLYAPLNDVDRDLCSLIYSGLFRVNSALEPEPDLVHTYRWSEDGKMLEVSLRKDARFHDGVPVTADDVIFTYQRVLDPRWRSPLTNGFKGLRQVIRVDESTIQFQLEAPNPNLLMELTLGILPTHIWEGTQGATAALAEANLKPIGSGPYRLESLKRDAKGNILSFTLTRFPQYYGYAPYIDTWQFRFYGDRPQAHDALQTNQVDAVAFVPWKDLTDIKHGNIQSSTLELPQETIAFFNIKDNLLKDLRIRQALSMAIDRRELQELIGSNANVASSPFPFLEATSTQAGDLDGARVLLNSLGWRLPANGSVRVYEAPTTPTRGTTTVTPPKPAASSTELAITIDLPDQADLIKVAELLKRRWSLIGARVEMRVHQASDLLRQALDKRDYQVLVWNVLLPPTQDISPFWASSQITNQGLNLANLADREVDKALETIQSATTTPALESARQTLSQAILKQTPALFLLRPAYAYLISQDVKGVQPMRLSKPSDRLLQASSWYIETDWKWR
jgi:peptide/nickel transport system substrate-binding protein